ncbi:MAG: hypothetical protein FWH49_08195, partial [Clostridiales bacterium]|nr:hypothetical protein [Clostridiales bacterium]
MKTEKLMDYIGQIDDDIIAQAEDGMVKSKQTKRFPAQWVSIGVAAAACLIVAVTFMMSREQPSGPVDYSGLPKLTINAESGLEMGFEGYMAFDISELSNGNPWNASEVIKTLPVFQNPVSYDDSWNPSGGLTVDEMKEKASQAATALGVTVESVFTNPTEEMIQMQKEKDPTAPTPTPYEAVAICGDVTIRVLPNGQVRVFFDDAVSLPEQYSLTYDNTTAQQARDVV